MGLCPIFIASVALFVAYARWEWGADHLLVGIGRMTIQVLTFGRVRLPREQLSDAGAIAAGTATVLFFFVLFLLVTNYLA